MLRAWRSCSTTSSNRHPDDLEGAGVDYIHPGVRIRTRHTAHALPDKCDIVCCRDLNEQRGSYPTSWASLGQLGDLLQQVFRLDYQSPAGLVYEAVGAVAAAELAKFRFDAAEWRRRQALAELRYPRAHAYDSVC